MALLTKEARHDLMLQSHMKGCIKDIHILLTNDLKSIITSLTEINDILQKGTEEYDAFEGSPVLRQIEEAHGNISYLHKRYRELLSMKLRWEIKDGRKVIPVSSEDIIPIEEDKK